MKIKGCLASLLVVFLLASCNEQSLNSPYPQDEGQHESVFYTSFAEQPKTLDPARSYSSNELQFSAQIYEPPLQYHYLKRPYQLVPLTAKAMPTVSYLNKERERVSASSKSIAYSVYTIEIKPNIFYQPHPALAKNKQGNYVYHHLAPDFIDEHSINRLNDFKQTGTRELTASDYVYQIKRLASPRLHSPIFGLMSHYIDGMTELSDKLRRNVTDTNNVAKKTLRDYSLSGARALDKYRYQIILKGTYPQFIYWLAMPFFSPVPWEADAFYQQAGMSDNNLSLSWYPIGTGPYLLSNNDPNRQMTLSRNPNFHGEAYPSVGMSGDSAKGLLNNAGKPMPFIDKFIFTLEKESIPRWNKFLQGFYDTSGISSDSFDQAIKIDAVGKPILSQDMLNKAINLQATVEPSIYYLGFNMLDTTVGGSSKKTKLLRRAIAIALNYEEYIAIFMNGRGTVAQSPIPPGIEGYQTGKAGINPYVYRWQSGKPKRRSLSEAKRLLSRAGYPNGVSTKTGKPLVLNYDVPASSGPDDKARFNWFRKQFARLGIQLNIRATQYNRFQEKVRNGSAQLFSWGWLADYPDPENFLFLLYGPNGKVHHGGENASNYNSHQFNQLFKRMKHLPPGEKRQAVLNKMVKIVQADAPWIFGVFPKTLLLSHQWVGPYKSLAMGNNTLKYKTLDDSLRRELRKHWNTPIIWPLAIFLLLIVVSLLPVCWFYYKREHHLAERL